MKSAIRYSFISRYLPLAFTPLAIGCQSKTAGEVPPPNVLFILTDDMQATSIHALGNRPASQRIQHRTGRQMAYPVATASQIQLGSGHQRGAAAKAQRAGKAISDAAGGRVP